MSKDFSGLRHGDADDDESDDDQSSWHQHMFNEMAHEEGELFGSGKCYKIHVIVLRITMNKD